MKTFAVMALAVVLAAPVVTVPTPSDAQVLVGGGRRRLPPRPPLSEREETRLYDAQNAIYDLQMQIDAIEATPEPTAEQAAALPDLRQRLAEEQAVAERLEAKRDRRS
jgi:hypothetical protein